MATGTGVSTTSSVVDVVEVVVDVGGTVGVVVDEPLNTSGVVGGLLKLAKVKPGPSEPEPEQAARATMKRSRIFRMMWTVSYFTAVRAGLLRSLQGPGT
jgi:hypothetical protein